MSKKYVILKTTSTEKLNEIRPHFLKYNIECTIDFISISLPIAILKEHSELTKNIDGTATVTSTLIVEQIEGTDPDAQIQLVTKRVYTTSAHGFLAIENHHQTHNDPPPWGYDAKFIPDGLMTSYYKLKKKGLKISPRDMNIGYFLQDFIHYETTHWTFKELKITRSVDLEVDYRKILFEFFDLESQQNFIGYDFWKGVVNAAISGGLFIRKSTTRKMNNYWWPVGNAGLPVTNKPKDPIHEKTYLMHDIFHCLVPDLLYTGNESSLPYYEWSYTLHRVMTECFTLILGDMFYVHYLTVNGIVYKTVEQRCIYPIFQMIYGSRTDVFKLDTLEEVIRASVTYGLYGYDAGFVALFVKYNGVLKLEEFRTSLKNFRDKYDYYLIQDLKWTINNAVYMKEHAQKYQYLNQLQHITKRLEIIPLDSLELSSNPQKQEKQEVNYFVDVGFKQLRKALIRPVYPENTILKNKFLRWAIGQLCFFEHYASISIVDGYKEKFYQCMEDILSEQQLPITINRIKNFRYQWDYLMVKCVEMQIITQEESNQYKELFPIFDPHYISSYSDKTEKHVDVMKHFLNDFEF